MTEAAAVGEGAVAPARVRVRVRGARAVRAVAVEEGAAAEVAAGVVAEVVEAAGEVA